MPKRTPKIVLIDRAPADHVPDLAVYATDAGLRPIQTAKVDADGNFDLPTAALERAAFVAIGRYEEKPERLVRGQVALYRSTQFRDLLKQSDTVELARGIWETILHYRRCVSGRVRRCSWWPWWYDRIELLTTTALARRLTSTAARAIGSASAIRGSAISVSPARLLPGDLTIFPVRRCSIVCQGLVEVYRRTCCWWPIVVLDPRIPILIDILERYQEVRIPRFPPNPPDPPPFETVEFFRGGALDEAIFNAPRDLAALRSLPVAEQPAYIEARPYLRHWFHCGDYHKVGQGLIQPDGTFQVCWWAFPQILLPNCHDEVAYVVKQLVNGTTITIYDGLAAGQWFGIGENPTLTSYSPFAVGCRDGDDPRVEGAVIYLDAIGGTDAYNLKTPDAAGWDRVDPPVFNDGLCFPATAAAAEGNFRNCNWGGSLYLRYWFTEPTRATGAHYYRVSIRRAAGATGNPDGSAPIFLGPPGGAWQKLVMAGGGGLDLVSVPLGAPGTPGGQTDLYVIPYDANLPANEEWRDGQYHAVLPTNDHPAGRYLLTLEVFDVAGNRLRPNGAAGAGNDAGFRYMHWVAPGTPDTFDNVPFAGLTHMLWWDNRPGTGDIIGLRQDGTATSGICQFLAGNANSRLSIDFIAHHPEDMFHWAHSLTWYQGVNGSSGSIPVMAPFHNEGAPPATAATSTEVTFGSMLGAHTKCSFALHLNMSLKTFNGSSALYPSAVREVAAFALDIS